MKKKVVVAGEEGVGKTSLMMAVSDAGLSTGGRTVGVDFFVVRSGGSTAVIFDLSGRERFRVLTPSLARGASLAVLVFDVTRPETLEPLKRWACSLKCRKILVANKADSGGLSSEELERAAREVGADRVVVTSVKDGRGLEELRSAILAS